MYWFLLKKALPFTLTFIFGAALSALIGLFGGSRTSYEVAQYQLGEYGRGRRECRMRGRNLVAETKPLNILDVPDAHYPGADRDSVRVNVMFKPDGKVGGILPASPLSNVPDGYRVMDREMWEAVERAAYGIRFKPETINGMPVTVYKEVEIKLVTD